VRAIVLAGTTGEGGRLDGADRRALLAAVQRTVPAELPLIVGTGAAEADAALSYTREVREGGAAGVLVHPPEDAELAPFFAEIRAAAGPLTVIAYHFPKHYPAVPVAVLDDLDIDGLKDSAGDRERLRDEAAAWEGDVYTGFVPLLSAAAGFGAAGAILALANLRPELAARAFGGDGEAQDALLPEHAVLKAGGVGAIKRILAAAYGTPPHLRADA
jgi:4-hydroxy-tetrahydrodipicolinate synthase